MFVCILRALTRTQNTYKHVLQLGVAAGDPPVRVYCPYRLKNANSHRFHSGCRCSAWNLSFDEAFADALKNLPPPPNIPDWLDVVTVIEIKGE